MPVKKVWPRLTMSADELVEEATAVGLWREHQGASLREEIQRERSVLSLLDEKNW